jgi:microsomal dipeptidase-like Zn-dependent dipeptidase
MGVEHVGLGADFVDQVVPISSSLDPDTSADKRGLGLEGFTAPDEYPALVDTLQERGYTGEPLQAILNGNWLRILRQTLP